MTNMEKFRLSKDRLRVSIMPTQFDFYYTAEVFYIPKHNNQEIIKVGKFDFFENQIMSSYNIELYRWFLTEVNPMTKSQRKRINRRIRELNGYHQLED